MDEAQQPGAKQEKTLNLHVPRVGSEGEGSGGVGLSEMTSEGGRGEGNCCVTTYSENGVAGQPGVGATGGVLWRLKRVRATVLLVGGSSSKNLVKYLCRSCCCP